MKEIPPCHQERERIWVKVRSPLHSSKPLDYEHSNYSQSLAAELSSHFTQILLELSS